MKTNKVLNKPIYWILFLGFLLAGSASQAGNGPMLYASLDSQLKEVRQGVQLGSLESKRIQNELIGEWFYEPILTHTNLGFLWKSIKVESEGNVSVSYQLDASKETVTKRGRLEFIHKGTADAFPGKRPAFLIHFNEGGKEEVMAFIEVTVNYDSRVPQQEGRVLKFRDLEGREFLFLRQIAMGGSAVLLLAATYSLTDLDTVGGLQSYAFSLNNQGQVVGYLLTRETMSERIFLYTEGRMLDLGSGEAKDINAAGQIVGKYYGDTERVRGFVYDQGRLDFLDYWHANGINEQGQVVGGNGDNAVMWSDGKITDLGTLGGNQSEAKAINSRGQVVGWSITTNDQRHAFLYEHGQMADLGTLGGTHSVATAINDDGQVVGRSTTVDGQMHAFLFINGKMVNLGTLTEGGSEARGINNRGQVVGIASGRAFLYENGRMLDLNDLIPETAGFVVEVATSINESGQIVGIGQSISHYYHAFLLTPCSPSPAEEVTFITLAGAAGLPGAIDGKGTQARLYAPCGLSVDGVHNLYVADMGNHTIRKISPGGEVVLVAGLAGQSGHADGLVGEARFNSPEGIAANSGGSVYVADSANHTIRKISPAGVVTTLAGLAESPGSSDGTGSEARFNNIKGIAVDGSGFVWVADFGNHTIRKISPEGKVTTLAGKAGEFGSTDGSLAEVRFYGPYGVAVDKTGNAYVADCGNSILRKISTNGLVTTLAGWPGIPGSIDGPGRAARFWFPAGIAVDDSDNLYVSDSKAGVIRKVFPDGRVITLAGAPHMKPADFGDNGNGDGTGSSARFTWPYGVAVDQNGDIMVADSLNHTIRRSLPTCPDKPVIDFKRGAVGSHQQLDIDPQTATSWLWSLVRRPTGSTAELSSAIIRNPTFIPDVADVYVFQLCATNTAGAVCIRRLELQVTGSTAIMATPHPELREGRFTLSLATTSFSVYVLERKNSLSDTNWTTIDSLSGDGTIKTLTDAMADGPQRFYRVRVESW